MRENETVEKRSTAIHHFENRYFERMARSLGDKAKLLEYLPPIVEGRPAPRVLDVGAGGGEFAEHLRLAGYDVTALDASNDAIDRIRKNFPKVTTARYLANHVDELGSEIFDAIICSSILHEVFSYGDDVHKAGHLSSIDRAFDSFNKALTPGGTLIIRDGVLPDNWDDLGYITFGEEGDEKDLATYLEMCPFANGTSTKAGDIVKLHYVAQNTYLGNVRSLMEFAYTYTWGVQSYHRETQELYGVLTLDGYADLLKKHGYAVNTCFSYLQPGYPEHLKNKLALHVNGEVDNWFDSNAIWVATKK
jgi:SAM-dependent methyltransferase